MKYILLSCLATSMLMGMNNDNEKHHPDGFHYAQAGEPTAFRGLYTHKIMYPVFIKQKGSDDKLQAWFNCDKPIKLMEWDKGGKYILYVTLNNDEKHTFCLNHLQNVMIKKTRFLK